ncbi:hypothetical protein HPC37_00720 [Pasteurellaceae bacterium 20609_3]|uniref:hypothetical protein n=1 Tax=Spirabiliibacterium mucosae TaxID=28156 RepID=UPI001AAD424F|nr:hypothetical protein [Spirabiliibacterium mucosae]MBE2897404.1 hypothetical protein [Spirabiliibacterium mucosae]
MLRNITLFIICFTLSNFSHAYHDEYEIEVSHDDEYFVINDEVFTAQTYCFNMNEGDRVIFIEGSPYELCTSAEILNLDTKERCSLWCE